MGFWRKSKAPAVIASFRFSCVPTDDAITTLALGSSASMALSASTPVILGVNELTVEASNSQAVNMLSKMNGNVKRALSSMGYETDGNFSLKIVYHRKSEKNPSKRKTTVKKIETNEERVAQYMSGAPESLPEDINRAVSHLRDYLEDRRRKFNAD